MNWLVDAKLLKDHGWLCTAVVVWSVVLRAASRMISVCAAVRDFADAPSGGAVFTALVEGLPKTLPVLEKRLNGALTGCLPRRMRRGSREVAIDFHLVPYYGRPHKIRNELYYGKPRQGTKHFHAFFNVPVAELLQRRQLPFLMPVMFRGRRPKRPTKTGLHWIKRQPAGWYNTS